MGHWIRLKCACCDATLMMDESFEDGGTYLLGGTDECELSVTYNYGKIYDELFPKEGRSNGAISWLYGRKARDTLVVLSDAIYRLGTHRSENYWDDTPGNAGAALARLRDFASVHPEGIWEGD